MKQEINERIRKQTYHLEYLKQLEKIKYQNSIKKEYSPEKYSSIGKGLTESKNNSKEQSHLYSDVKKYPIQMPLQNKQSQQYKQINSYQYDQPLEDNSSILVQKYNQGIKAEQYYQDMRKLDQLQEKLKAIGTVKNYNLPKSYNIIGQQKLSPELKGKNVETHQFQRSPIKSTQRSPQRRTVEKNNIPIIKEDVSEGVQTVINSAHKVRNVSDAEQKNIQTSDFVNERLKNIINLQKNKQLNVDKKENNKSIMQRPLSSRLKLSSRKKNSKSKYMANTIDMYALNKSDNSPIKRIRDNSQRKYKNPYINSSNKKQKKSKQNVSKVMNKRNRSVSQPIKPKQVVGLELFIPAPLFPQSETINYEETALDKIRLLCNQSKFFNYKKKLEIQKRIKISSIVFKDSKLRNAKHEVDHLWHKYENQIKGRREVKDKINTNPNILKKHKMVVQ